MSERILQVLNRFYVACATDADEFTDVPGEDGKLYRQPFALAQRAKRIEAKLDGIMAAIKAIGTSNPDVAAILAGVDEKLAELRTEVREDTRDAVADGYEWGVSGLRAGEAAGS